MRKLLIAANWKMYKTPQQTAEYFDNFLPLISGHTRDDIAIFPSATSLPAAVAAAAGSGISIGCQNMHWEDEGAFTGETSAPMVTATGATHILIGHSERRQYFGETDEQVNRKLKTALRHNLVPLVCVGETDEERSAGRTDEVLSRQIAQGLKDLAPEELEPLVLAYEPVWAIGTGKTATPELAAAAHLHAREVLAKLFGRKCAERTRILYGGSVKPENAATLMNEPGIDGALVGGASLNPRAFADIVKYGER